MPEKPPPPPDAPSEKKAPIVPEPVHAASRKKEAARAAREERSLVNPPPGKRGILIALRDTVGIDTGSEDPVQAILKSQQAAEKLYAWLECMEWAPHQANKEEGAVFFAAVRVCAMRKDSSRVERVMLSMVACGVPATLAMYTELIHMLGRRGDMKGARAWLIRMKRSGLKADSQLYSCLIHVCARGGSVESATEWYNEMLRDGLTPTEVTLNSMINACAKAGVGLDEAEGWFHEIEAWRLHPSRYTYNSIVHACCEAGATERAEAWLMDMLRVGLGPDTVSYATIIHATNKHSVLRVKQVDRLMRHMLDNIVPDPAQLSMLFRAAIQVCARGRELDLALHWASVADEKRLSIGRYSYKFIAIGLRRNGRHKDAATLEKRIATLDEEKRILMAERAVRAEKKRSQKSDENVLDVYASDDMSTTGAADSELGDL